MCAKGRRFAQGFALDLKYLQYGSTQIAGHEFAGVLDDGTAVAVEGFFGCGKCDQCEQGIYNMCAQGPTATGMLSPGGMSEWFLAPSHVLCRCLPGLTSPTRRSWSRRAWHGTAVTRVT